MGISSRSEVLSHCHSPVELVFPCSIEFFDTEKITARSIEHLLIQDDSIDCIKHVSVLFHHLNNTVSKEMNKFNPLVDFPQISGVNT